MTRQDVKVRSTNEGIVITGATVDFVQKAIEHAFYLRDYRKNYGTRKRAKFQAMKDELRKRGANVEKLEADAVANLRKSQ